MSNTNKQRDVLPETFASEEEAGEFWDTHSMADYEEYLEPVEMTIDIRTRHYMVELDQENFMALVQYSNTLNQPVNSVANKLMKEKLATVSS